MTTYTQEQLHAAVEKALAEKDAALAEKDAVLAEKDAAIRVVAAIKALGSNWSVQHPDRLGQDGGLADDDATARCWSVLNADPATRRLRELILVFHMSLGLL
jgi:hypothetical protein